MRKLTTEEWVIKANIVHKNTYDYSKVIYVKSTEKVLICCKIHGDFEQQANCHLQGQGCPKCRYIKSSKSKTLTQEDFIERCILKHNDKYDYSNTIYINSRNKIKVCCKIHGEFLISPFHHLDGSGCKICNGGGSKYTTEEFIKKAIDVHGDTYDYSKVKYIDKESPVIIICPKHGEFLQKPHNHISGGGCQNCRISFQQNKLFRKLKADFTQEIIKTETSPL